MVETLSMIPLVIVAGALIYGLHRNVIRVWLDHRVKIALLQRLECKPELLQSFDELQELLNQESDDSAPDDRQDIVVTGGILALIGGACLLLASRAGTIELETSIFFGGAASVVIGFLMALVGFVIQRLSRLPVHHDEDE